MKTNFYKIPIVLYSRNKITYCSFKLLSKYSVDIRFNNLSMRLLHFIFYKILDEKAKQKKKIKKSGVKYKTVY